ncbi:MAG: chromosome segregation protein SMC, partial [Planctomycetota bacterium]
ARAEGEAQAGAEAAEQALAAAEAARAVSQGQEAEARSARSEAEGEASALRAEVQALSRLLARDETGGTQILDELAVTPGYEKALGAALADDLKAPRTEGAGSGWRALPDYARPQALPAGVEALAAHVSLPDVLARRMAQVGVVSAEDAPALQAALAPGQRLVSLEGDLWRWDGYVVAGEDAPSAAALKLEQMNRLSALKTEEEAAEARALAAREAHDACLAELATKTEADKAAREARRQADRSVAEAARALSRAEAERNLTEGKLETLTTAVARMDDEQSAARAQLAEAERGVAELPDIAAARAELEDVKLTVEASRVTMLAHRTSHDELRRVGEARTKRAQEITKELSGWRHRLDTATGRAEELGARKAASETELVAARGAPGEVAARRAALASEIDTAEARRKAAADALADAEGALRACVDGEREAERAASSARESRARTEARYEAAKEALEAAAERIMEAQSVSPADLLASLNADPDAMPEAERIEADVARLRRQRDALGAVNLRAEEDAREVETERDTLATEKEDLEAAISTLRAGIASLNKEGRERLLAAFDEVNRNFSVLFTHLFGGGEAKLVLVESEDPLEAGLEIMCQPPGKKLSTLSLLSGGEQTLTALALIFAVFLANPAPICVLDEVDAPLDDANVTRFCDLLDEMTRRTETRFLIITHHAVTMSRMNRLFGVTMQEQ